MDGDGFAFGGAWHPYTAHNIFFNFRLINAARFCLYHSRFMVNRFTYPRQIDKPVISRLGVADKLAIIYTPLWMYRKGELTEYMSKEGYKYGKETKKLWKSEVDAKCRIFVEEWREKAYDIQQY